MVSHFSWDNIESLMWPTRPCSVCSSAISFQLVFEPQPICVLSDSLSSEACAQDLLGFLCSLHCCHLRLAPTCLSLTSPYTFSGKPSLTIRTWSDPSIMWYYRALYLFIVVPITSIMNYFCSILFNSILVSLRLHEDRTCICTVLNEREKEETNTSYLK